MPDSSCLSHVPCWQVKGPAHTLGVQSNHRDLSHLFIVFSAAEGGGRVRGDSQGGGGGGGGVRGVGQPRAHHGLVQTWPRAATRLTHVVPRRQLPDGEQCGQGGLRPLHLLGRQRGGGGGLCQHQPRSSV